MTSRYVALVLSSVFAFATTDASAQAVRRVPGTTAVPWSDGRPPGATPATAAERARLHADPNRKYRRSLHTVFGTIASMRGDVFVLTLRNGRPLTVDASIAVAHDAFSAPLFVGKTVRVEGEAKNASVFSANNVFREDTLAGLPADR